MTLRYLLAILLMLHVQAGWAAAGRFLSVVGDVRVVGTDGRQRAAVRGADVESGETIRTATGAFTQLNMSDGARLAVREDSELKLDDYSYDEDRGAGRSFMSLLRGTMRSLTGLIGGRDKSAYSVRTPHATIGIRGTDHQVTVLLKPRDGFQPGTFDVVFTGMTVMRTGAGAVQIAPQQAGYVTGQSARPQVIRIPAFLQREAARNVPATPAATRSRAATDRGDGGKDDATADGGSRRVPDSSLRDRLGATGSTGDRTAVTPSKSLRTPLDNPLTSPLQSGKTGLSTTPTLRTPLSTTTTPTLQERTSLPTTTTTPTLTTPTVKLPTTTLTTPTVKTPTTTLTTPTVKSPTTTLIQPRTTTTTTSPTRTISPTTTIQR